MKKKKRRRTRKEKEKKNVEETTSIDVHVWILLTPSPWIFFSRKGDKPRERFGTLSGVWWETAHVLINRTSSKGGTFVVNNCIATSNKDGTINFTHPRP